MSQKFQHLMQYNSNPESQKKEQKNEDRTRSLILTCAFLVAGARIWNDLPADVSSLPRRRRLRSSFTLQLHIPQYHLSTAGRRSFPVAASIFWNTLRDDVQYAVLGTISNQTI